jgi:TolA-binding protein
MASQRNKAKHQAPVAGINEQVDSFAPSPTTPESTTATDQKETKMSEKMTLEQITEKIAEIDKKISELNIQRNDFINQRKTKAKEVIKLNEIKVEDFAEFEEIVQARVEAELKARDVAARTDTPPPPPPKGGKKTKVNPTISLPAGEYNYKFNGKNIVHGGKRPSDDLETIINGPVIDTTTGKRDPSKRIMSLEDFKLLLIKVE